MQRHVSYVPDGSIFLDRFMCNDWELTVTKFLAQGPAQTLMLHAAQEPVRISANWGVSVTVQLFDGSANSVGPLISLLLLDTGVT
jgi:hypothetical protein